MSRVRPYIVVSAVLAAAPLLAGGKMSQTSEPGFHLTKTPDLETGWTVYVLSWRDPQDPGRSVTAKLVPEAGSNLISLAMDGVEILHAPPTVRQSAGVGYGVPILYPTPNRVRNSSFVFDGKGFEFSPNERTHFIHGLVHRASWSVEAATAAGDSVTVSTYLDFDEGFTGFPFFPIRNRLRMSYTLTSDGVHIEFEVQNRDSRRLPFGFALHPYFKILGERAQTFLRIPAQRHMEAEGLLPTGKLESLDGSPYDIREFTSLESLKLDDVFWGMVPAKPAAYECRDKRIRVRLEASDLFTHAVVYTPQGRPYFCIENQTCSTDAHNLHARGLEKESHLLILNPGETARGSVRIRAQRF